MNNQLNKLYINLRFKISRPPALYIISILAAVGIISVFVLRLNHPKLPEQQPSDIPPVKLTWEESAPEGKTRSLKLFLDSGNSKIAFIRTELAYDNKKLKLSEEISDQPGWTIIEKTTMNDANRTGKIVLVYGLPTGRLADPPFGLIDVATFPFTLVTDNKGNENSISFVHSGLQIVDTDSHNLTVQTTDIKLDFNKLTSPTISPDK